MPPQASRQYFFPLVKYYRIVTALQQQSNSSPLQRHRLQRQRLSRKRKHLLNFFAVDHSSAWNNRPYHKYSVVLPLSLFSVLQKRKTMSYVFRHLCCKHHAKVHNLFGSQTHLLLTLMRYFNPPESSGHYTSAGGHLMLIPLVNDYRTVAIAAL